jgi:hypothetical protein
MNGPDRCPANWNRSRPPTFVDLVTVTTVSTATWTEQPWGLARFCAREQDPNPTKLQHSLRPHPTPWGRPLDKRVSFIHADMARQPFQVVLNSGADIMCGLMTVAVILFEVIVSASQQRQCRDSHRALSQVVCLRLLLEVDTSRRVWWIPVGRPACCTTLRGSSGAVASYRERCRS